MGKNTKKKLLTKVTNGVAFGDTSNSAVRNVLTQISKELYGKLTEDMMEKTLDFFQWRCPYTGAELKPLIDAGTGYAADHIYPQNKDWCGLNVQGNLILVTKEANAAKLGLDVETFLLTDTKELTDIDKMGRSRQERLDNIRAFQAKFQYDPKLIRNVVKPIMEERYQRVREEQEECISKVLLLLENEGIKSFLGESQTKTSMKDESKDNKGKGYTYSEKLEVAEYYLTHDEGLVQVEENFMHLTGRNGATAKYILNIMGVDTSRQSTHKGLLIKHNIDDEIIKSTGIFKNTLEEIKKRTHKNINYCNLEPSINKHIYIRYKKGWSSFVPLDEHVTGYCIDNDTITISYGVSFIGDKKECKKISGKDMKELIEILDFARNNDLFEKSNTHILTEHAPISSYEYQYRDMSGVDCGELFIDSPLADTLKARYSNLINKLLK